MSDTAYTLMNQVGTLISRISEIGILDPPAVFWVTDTSGQLKQEEVLKSKGIAIAIRQVSFGKSDSPWERRATIAIGVAEDPEISQGTNGFGHTCDWICEQIYAVVNQADNGCGGTFNFVSDDPVDASPLVQREISFETTVIVKVS